MKIFKICSQVVIALLVAQLNLSQAQDLKHALSQMKDVMQSTDQLHVAMDIMVFESAAKKNQIYHDHVEVKRDKDNCLYRYDNSDFLMNDRFMVRIDREVKEITWAHRKKSTEQKFKQQLTFNLDSVLKEYENPQFITDETTRHHYRAFPRRGSVKQVDLFFDLNAHLLQRMDYQYSNGQLVTISFIEWNIHPQFKTTTFDESSYLTIKGNSVTPDGKYKLFRITNVDSENPLN